MFEIFQEINQQNLRTGYEQLKDFIYRLQEKKFEQAEMVRNQISTTEELQQYNKEMQSQFVAGIGGLMEVSEPLDAKVVESSDKGEFILENIIYRSHSNIYVTASMYIPKGITKPSPAVLFLSGHTEEARMSEEYQIVCRTLVKAGLIVFAIDPTGQGERISYYNDNEECSMERSVLEHDSYGVPAVATGKFLARYFLCDEMRAVDYMLTRPEIDPKRIGVTGNSGGGTQTMVMMACDERIAAAAPGTFVTNRREIMYNGLPQDSEQIWPGAADFGFDHISPLMIFAPRPVAILAVTSDFFPIEGTRETFEEARRFYKMYGKEENIRLYEDDYTHWYTPKLAVYAAEFFTETFFGDKRTVTNQDIEILPSQEMWASQNGNILEEYKDAGTFLDCVRECADRQRAVRLALPLEERRERAKKWLEERVMYGRVPTDFNVRMYYRDHGAEVVDGYMGIPISWWTQRRLFSYGVLVKQEESEHEKQIPTVIAIWPDGTKEIAHHAEWIQRQCDEGKQVLVLDVPGMGNIEQQPLTQDMRQNPYKAVYGTLRRLCCDLIYSGDSLAAMHCYDVLRTIEMLGTEFGIEERDITLYCEGNDGIYGVMAGFLNENVKTIYGPDLLMSVEKDIVGQQIFKYDNTLGLIVPGMLEYFDYEELQ